MTAYELPTSLSISGVDFSIIGKVYRRNTYLKPVRKRVNLLTADRLMITQTNQNPV